MAESTQEVIDDWSHARLSDELELKLKSVPNYKYRKEACCIANGETDYFHIDLEDLGELTDSFIQSAKYDILYEAISNLCKIENPNIRSFRMAIFYNGIKMEIPVPEKNSEKLLDDNGQIDPLKVALELERESEYINVDSSNGGIIHHLENGIWVSGAENKLLHRIEEITERKASIQCKSQTIAHVRDNKLVQPDVLNSRAGLIPFANGVYDRINKQFRDYRGVDYFTCKLAAKYDPLATDWEPLKKVMLDILGEDQLQLFLDGIAETIAHEGDKIQAAFFLYGSGSNGKDTLFNMIQNMIIGIDQCSSVPLQTLETRFGLYDIYKGWSNICAEMPTKVLKDCNNFKKSTGGSRLRADIKGKGAINFVYKGFHWFAGNEIPEIEDKTHGFNRRWVVLKCNTEFCDHPIREDQMKKIPSKKLEEITTNEAFISGLMNYCIQRLNETLDAQGDIPDRPLPEDNLQFWNGGDSMDKALSEVVELAPDPKMYVRRSLLYKYYVEECNKKELRPRDNKKFLAGLVRIRRFRDQANKPRIELSDVHQEKKHLLVVEGLRFKGDYAKKSTGATENGSLDEIMESSA